MKDCERYEKKDEGLCARKGERLVMRPFLFGEEDENENRDAPIGHVGKAVTTSVLAIILALVFAMIANEMDPTGRLVPAAIVLKYLPIVIVAGGIMMVWKNALTFDSDKGSRKSIEKPAEKRGTTRLEDSFKKFGE